MTYDAIDLWQFLPAGYLLTITVETLVLLTALSMNHSLRVRLFAGAGLTAVTYPIVILVMPLVLMPFGRAIYLAVAEVFAPVAESVLFVGVFGSRGRAASNARDCFAICAANLASFLIGVWYFS